MEKLNEKITISAPEKQNEIVTEQSIDTEFTLPDYYPEISKILKCLTEVSVLSKQIKGNTAEIGGQVSVTLLYSDKENNLNSFSHICPFVKSVEVGDIGEENHISCVLRGEFLNSKATAPRKVEIHGSVTLGVTVELVVKTNCICNDEKEGVFTKCSDTEYCEMLLPIAKSVFLEDEISIGANRQAISKILRTSAESVINECKIITNKVVVKGELKICVLYCPVQSNRPILLEHTHGFSQIFDRDSLDETCECSAYSSVASFEIRPKTGLDGEVKSLIFESKVNIELFTEKKIAVCLVTDAFTNINKSELETSVLNLPINSANINENYLCKKSLDFSSGAIGEVYDLWCKTAVNFSSCDGGELLLKGVVLVYVLGVDGEGVPVFYERSFDYEYRYSLQADLSECKSRYNVSIAAVNYSKNPESGIDIAVELTVNAQIFKINRINAVTGLKIDAGSNIERDNETAITLYFAENETVWEIAKKYLADPQKICIANNIEQSDNECNGILLIPNA